MRRWTVEKTELSRDKEYLQVCIIYPEEVNKVQVKAENRCFYRRYVI